MPRPSQRSRRGLSRWILGISGFFLALMILEVPIYRRRSETCAACRAARISVAVVGFECPWVEETAASRWYRENVESLHGHVWVSPARCTPVGIPFISYGVACSMGSPIFRFEPEEQVEIYSHFEDRLAAKSIFLGIGQLQIDGDEYMKLLDWKDAGFPGRYADWKERELARRGTLPGTP